MLKNRGPDSSKVVYKHGILFHGTVLSHHRGDTSTEQPVVSDDLVLLFNGDLYMDCMEDENASDTKFLFELISNAKNEDELLEAFRSVKGPFSVICYFQSKLYFARDSLGRNSLIIGRQHDGIFISSVIDTAGEHFDAVEELPPFGVCCIELNSLETRLFPYELNHPNMSQLQTLKEILQINICKEFRPEWRDQPCHVEDFCFKDLCRNLKTPDVFDELLKLPIIESTCETFIRLLSNSVSERIAQTPKRCKNCISSSSLCCHSHIGILFSGGVDCSMLARLADKFIDSHKPIDLMNVAFEKVNYSNQKSETIDWNVPDRLTGIETLEELRRLCPGRAWNFVEINITRRELDEHMEKLSSLVFPMTSVIDESLGAALYFASRGIGAINEVNYSSPCRVILMGSGADELFGGYTRHRNAFRRSTAERDLLLEELNLDWARLPSRNLARDDRVIADNGITVRCPFVEENFVNFVQQLKPLQRCYPALPEGVGDKLLLRLSAFKLGLQNCSTFKKRALQFGSRVADKRQSAKDTSKVLKNGRK